MTEYQMLREFAKQLGWPSLRRHTKRFPKERGAPSKILWYDVGDVEDVNLMVNPAVRGRGPIARVYALRYRICTEWLELRRRGDRIRLREHDRSRVHPLAFSNFSTLEGRRAFRRDYPEFAGRCWSEVTGITAAIKRKIARLVEKEDELRAARKRKTTSRSSRSSARFRS